MSILHRVVRASLVPALALGMLSVATQASAGADDTDQSGGIVEVRSDRGVVAWLKQEPSIPTIALSAIWVQAGSVSDPAGLSGRANLVSGLLDEGSGEMDSQAFQQRLDELAVRLSFDAGRDSFSMNLQTLTDNAAQAFALAGQAMAQPRFDAEPVARIRRQILTGIARGVQDPNTIAAQLFFRKAYGNDPYGRPVSGTVESVSAITADDMRAFVGERLGRDRLIIGVVGDVSPDALKPLLDAAFGDLPATAKPLDLRDVSMAASRGLTVSDYPTSQTSFLFGLPGLKRDDPDYDAARVMNHMLGGGGFTSLLTEEVREKRGLTYGIYSYLRPMSRDGLWLGGLSTSNDKAAEAWQVLRDTIRRYAETGPTAERLANAQANMNGAFPLRLTSNKGIAGLLVALQRHDLGKDYVSRRPDLINAVTADDVKRIARRILDLDGLLAVAVGQPAGLASDE